MIHVLGGLAAAVAAAAGGVWLCAVIYLLVSMVADDG